MSIKKWIIALLFCASLMGFIGFSGNEQPGDPPSTTSCVGWTYCLPPCYVSGYRTQCSSNEIWAECKAWDETGQMTQYKLVVCPI